MAQPVVVQPVEWLFGDSWISLVLAVIVLLLALRWFLQAMVGGGRRRASRE